jgi:hypothetical protein
VTTTTPVISRRQFFRNTACASGVVLGLGIAGTVAAEADDAAPAKIQWSSVTTVATLNGVLRLPKQASADAP